MQYLPFAFFNLLNPLVALVYAFTGFRVEHLSPDASAPDAADAPVPVGDSSAFTLEGDGHVD
jgi:hypothetical protein